MSPTKVRFHQPAYYTSWEQRQPYAVTVVYSGESRVPFQEFRLKDSFLRASFNNLAWVQLAKAAFSDSRPLSQDERATVKKFFWSQY